MLYVAVGQAGVQLTEALADICPSIDSSSLIFIDSETKTLQKAAARLPQASFVATDTGGNGNCWSKGYFQTSNAVVERVCHNIQRNLERSCHEGLVLVHGLGGGTGSGFGSRLVECISDLFVDAATPLASISILPFESLGESPLQAYNSSLCLSFLEEFTDASIIVRNDDLVRSCAAKSFDYTTLNKIAWGHIMPSMQRFWDVLKYTSPDPSEKWIHAYSTDATAFAAPKRSLKRDKRWVSRHMLQY